MSIAPNFGCLESLLREQPHVTPSSLFFFTKLLAKGQSGGGGGGWPVGWGGGRGGGIYESFSVVIPLFGSQTPLPSPPAVSGRFDQADIADTARTLQWVSTSRDPGSMDDPNAQSPAMPHAAGSFAGSSLHGAGDCTEYNMLLEIKRLQQELKEERAQKEQQREQLQQEKEQQREQLQQEKKQQREQLQQEMELLQQRNMELLKAAEDKDRAIAVQATQLTRTQGISDRQRLHIRAQAAKMKRHLAARAKREQEVPRCSSKVLPEQMAGAALE